MRFALLNVDFITKIKFSITINDRANALKSTVSLQETPIIYDKSRTIRHTSTYSVQALMVNSLGFDTSSLQEEDYETVELAYKN